MKKIITFLLSTYLTLAPSSLNAEEIISYRANKDWACLELRVEDTKVKMCDGTKRDRDDKIDEISYETEYLEGICTNKKFDFKDIRNKLVEKYVTQFNNILEGKDGELSSHDKKRKYVMAELDDKFFFLSADKDNKTKKFYVMRNGFALGLHQDPFTQNLVEDLYERVLDSVNH
jgi:hypothetical protein